MEHGTTPSAPRPEHFRAIYDALPDPAGITRVADGMYLEVNPAFCQLLGMSREQAFEQARQRWDARLRSNKPID